MRELEATIWSLQMLDASELRPALVERDAPELRQAELPSPELNRFLYTAIGGPHHWIHRLGWSYAERERYLDPETVETWVAYVRGASGCTHARSTASTRSPTTKRAASRSSVPAPKL